MQQRWLTQPDENILQTAVTSCWEQHDSHIEILMMSSICSINNRKACYNLLFVFVINQQRNAMHGLQMQYIHTMQYTEIYIFMLL